MKPSTFVYKSRISDQLMRYKGLHSLNKYGAYSLKKILSIEKAHYEQRTKREFEVYQKFETCFHWVHFS
jgi:hypothetical protein